MQYTDNFDNILQKSPLSLLNWLYEEFNVEVPQIVVSQDDMKAASEALLKLSSYYSYLMGLLSYSKIKVREAKRTKSKEEHEDMVDRKDVLENFKEAIKHSYAAVSRAVTIYIENNAELKMGRGSS